MNFYTLIIKRFVDFGQEISKQAKTSIFWKDILIVFLGISVYILGFCMFIYPQRITTGGLAGISNLITLSTGIGISIPYNTINIILLVIAFIFLDKTFFVKTLIGIGILVFVMPYASTWAVPNPALESSWTLKILADSPPLALTLGAMLTGLGLGLVFSVNGSTGGTDVIVALVNKYKNISLGRIFIVLDGSIVILSYFINVYFAKNTIPQDHALNLLVYSILDVLITSITLDWYVNTNLQSVQFMIFSEKYQEINDAITKKLKRGCTLLDGAGGYTGKPVKVLLVVVRKRRSVGIGRLISEIDPKAFVSQCTVSGVYGEGFENVKKLK